MELIAVAEELISLYRPEDAAPRLQESIRLLREAIGYEATYGRARDTLYSTLDRANKLLQSLTQR